MSCVSSSLTAQSCHQMWKCTTNFIHLSTQHSKHSHSHTALQPPTPPHTHTPFLHLSISQSPSTECQTTAPRVSPLAPASRQGQPTVERSLKRSTQPVNLLLSVEHFQMKHSSSMTSTQEMLHRHRHCLLLLTPLNPLEGQRCQYLCVHQSQCAEQQYYMQSVYYQPSTSLRRDGQILGSW